MRGRDKKTHLIRKCRNNSSLKDQRQEAALIRLTVFTAAALTFAVMFMILFHIVCKGICGLGEEGLFDIKYNSENVSMMPALINTVIVTILSLLVAGPTGVFGAVYFTEYAKKGSIIVRVIRIGEDTLAAMPSIIYGLFGYGLFVISLGWGYTMISGVITLAVMVLPIIMRTAEEALMAVPHSYREAGFGLGAGKVRTVFGLLIPSAMPGIISGISLATGRIAGESAALIFTAGTYPSLPHSLFSSTRTLSVHIYALMTEGMYEEQAYAAALVLIIVISVINAVSHLLMKKFQKTNY